MDKLTPWADRISGEVDAFFRLWKNRRWLAIVMIISFSGVSVFSFASWFKRGIKVDALEIENRELKRDLRLLESENKGLRETVTPLIARAAKEFPGEEINTSLKKIIEKLRQQDPIRQPIVSCTVSVSVFTKSDEKLNSHFPTVGGYVLIGQGRAAILQASSHETWGKQLGNGIVRYSGTFTMPAESSTIGMPVKALKRGEYIQIEFSTMPENSFVTMGTAIFVINDITHLEFEIPEQQADGQRVFIRDLAEGMKTLTSNQ